MKKTLFILSMIAYVFISSCTEVRFGDDAFSDAPSLDGATIDSMFNSSYNADRVLAAAYSHLPYGVPTTDDLKLGSDGLEGITDLQMTWISGETNGPVNLYYNGSLSSSLNSTLSGSEAYRFADEDSYYAIRYGWLYIENASKIPDIDDATRNQRIAEAKVVIAISYAEMLRYVGGVPLIDHAIDVTEVMEFPRATFEATVNYIVQLLNEAAPNLPWSNTSASVDGGRLTKASALALKLRVLLFAASPTFNSDTKWHPAADEYTCYGNYSMDRWKAAYDAGTDFFTNLSSSGYYGLVQSSDQTTTGYRAAFRTAYYEQGSGETLISIRKSVNTNYHVLLAPNRAFAGPTLDYVNMFDWADGTAFDAENFDWDVDWESTDDYTIPFFIPVDGEFPGTETRDPRLYETVATPGSYCYNGVLAEVYTNATGYQGFDNNSGFYLMKFNLEQESDRSTNPHWPYLRLSEIYLSYAEAINEYDGATADRYQYLDAIRTRVGLGATSKRDMTQEEFRNYVLDERARELGFEEVRWFDMVRHGLVDDFTKPLHKLSSVGLAADGTGSATNPAMFSFKVEEIPSTRYWAKSWDTKWYLSPIPQDEVNLGYGMTQNPGW
ncbi:MAG: RagB/SusD family nutrient uptake outer membrane protein [Rikenellaceae bacterium]